MNKLKQVVCLAALLIVCGAANSQTRLTVTAEKVAGIPIAVLPFLSATPIPQAINEVIDNDLRSSGKFAPMPPRNFLVTPKNIDDVQYKDWRLIGADIVIVGEVTEIPPGLFDVSYKIYDIAQQKPLGGGSYQANSDQLRELAHLISDEVYENIIGVKGAYRTQLAYIKRTSGTSQLQVADWDGFNPTTIVTSTMPILSPTWSPDAKHIAFVNFDSGSSVIKSVDLDTGVVSTLIRSRRGFNSAPSYSPDGKKLAYSSSRSGNPEIYVYDLASKRNVKVTNHWGIDTEPTWMPNGDSLIFTSNRSGKANLYKVAATGGTTKRLTFEGKESAGADISSNGKRIAFVKNGGAVTIMNLKSGSLKALSVKKYDESPTFAPNGEMVVYATQQSGRGKLVVASSDGLARHGLKYLSGDVREPSWSPYTLDQ